MPRGIIHSTDFVHYLINPLLSYISCWNCLLKHVTEGKTGGKIEVTGRRGRRRKQLLDRLKGTFGYCKLQDEALRHTVENSFRKRLWVCRKIGYEWMNKWKINKWRSKRNVFFNTPHTIYSAMTEWRNKLFQLPVTNSQQLLVLIYPQCLLFALNDTVTPLELYFKIIIIRPAYPITNRFIRLRVCRRSIRSTLLHSYGWDRADQYSWHACNRVPAVLTLFFSFHRLYRRTPEQCLQTSTERSLHIPLYQTLCNFCKWNRFRSPTYIQGQPMIICRPVKLFPLFASHLNSIPRPKFKTMLRRLNTWLHFDKGLTWKNHVTTKRKQLDLKAREINWLIGKHSPPSLENKLLIYKTVLKPVWTYGIELWGCASKSKIAIIQRHQSKLLRSIINAPWYVSNHTLHSDLHIPHVHSVFRER